MLILSMDIFTGKLWTFKVNRRCRVRELKSMLLAKLGDDSVGSVDDLILMFGDDELSNDALTIGDYSITDGCTVVLEIDRR